MKANRNSVRPELVEGFWLRSWWFDKLTTNGLVNDIGVKPVGSEK